MKFFMVSTLLVTTVSSQSGCTHDEDTHTCANIELKVDEPLELDGALPKLFVVTSNGSIGVKTFSHLTQVKELRIMFNNISSIEDGALCALPNLEHLIIRGNEELPVLTKSHFTNCVNTKHFWLANGALETNAFEDNMPNLEIVELEHLKTSHFKKEYLQPLKQLKKLAISDCEFKKIDTGALCSSSQLKALYLSYNDFPPILTESLFENCNAVETFSYSLAVKQSKVEEGVFSGFVSLKNAMISQLDIDHLSKGHLRGLTNIENLELDNSNIRTVDKDSFEGLVKLTLLSLSSNSINNIDSEELGPLTILTNLRLSHNKLKSIDNIKHSSLEVLEVNENLINTVDAEAVKLNLPNLKTLDIRGNNFTNEYGQELSEKLEGIDVMWMPIWKFGYPIEL